MNSTVTSIPPGGRFSFKDVGIVRGEADLVISNSRVVRSFDLSLAVPRTTSLRSLRSGVEHVSESPGEGDFSFMGYNLPGSKRNTAYIVESVEVESNAASFLDGEHVVVRLRIRDSVQGLLFVREYFLYPELPVIACRCGIQAAVSPNIFWAPRCLSFNQGEQEYPIESRMDSLRLQPDFDAFRALEFRGRSDYSNDLLVERQHAGPAFSAIGNLLFAEKSGFAGMFILQEAPPSNERRDLDAHDFRFSDQTIHSCCWGIAPHEVRPDQCLYGYRSVIGLYEGKEIEGRRILKEYLRTRFPQNHQRDFSVMVNPWGSGTFHKDCSEQFLQDEIKASSELAATHYQIDDGWQTGKGLSALTRHNQAAGKDFWQPSAGRFPGGFAKLHEAATAHQIELALWIAPSFNREYRDWKVFVDLIGGLHRKFGIRMVKVDGVRLRTKEAEDNLEKMVRALRLESNGEILFDFDTTDGQRLGYFYFLEYGNIFLENRYACHNWGQVYHPELVLRNFWTLAGYVRPQTLQIEVTDYLNINRDYYQSQGISHPDVYSPRYWAAVTLFANPLIWLAPSKLAPSIKTAYREIIELHLQYREGIFSGEIFPVGSKPDGGSLTGFQSHRFEDNSGFLVLYRELGAPEAGSVEMHFVNPFHMKFTSLSDGSCIIEKPAGQDHLAVELESPGSFRLYKYQPKGNSEMMVPPSPKELRC